MQDNDIKENKTKVVLTVLKFLLLIFILVIIPLYIYFFHKDILDRFNNYQEVVHFLRGYKHQSVVIYLAAQILQIVFCFLPGQVFQFAAGSVFGFVPGLLLSIAGSIMGATVTYFLSRFLGEDALQMILGEEKMTRFSNWFNSEKAYLIAFLIYLIPGMPKDLVCYAAGVSKMKYSAFMIISTVGRLPGMCGSLLLGHLYMEGETQVIIITLVVVIIVLLLCFIFRNKLHSVIYDIYEKIS